MSFVLVRDRSRLGHKPEYRLGWSPEHVRKSMYACRSLSVACRPAEKRRQRGEIGSIHRSILVGHRRPNRRQGVNWSRGGSHSGFAFNVTVDTDAWWYQVLVIGVTVVLGVVVEMEVMIGLEAVVGMDAAGVEIMVGSEL